jgi:hypothetical protein
MAKRKLSGGRAVALKAPPRKAKPRPSRPSVIAHREPIYSVHPDVAMVQTWTRDLKSKTGRTLQEWVEYIKHDGPTTETRCVHWLQNTFGLQMTMVRWLAHKAFSHPLKLADDTPESYLALAPRYVEEMYAAATAELKAVYDELIRVARELGDDVRICPCKSIVPIYRRTLIAQIRPATAKRIHLYLGLGEEPFTARLRDFGTRQRTRIRHCVSLSSLADIDLQVKRWLKQAYERDA